MIREQQALANLEAWFNTMRQAGGYGGPVAHWWQNRYRYAGPGRDWRYEGILIAYSELFLKTTNDCYRLRLLRAIHDLSEAQSEQGHFAASKFEINPGTVGTPHEAAASLGLLEASQAIKSQEALSVAKRNLDALIAALWDEKGQGFNDSLTARGRVPNKLATFAQALFKCFELSKEEKYLNYARAAIDDVLAFQVDQGSNAGAIHQYAADAQSGDKRFFPYYNARCIPPLVIAAKVLNEAKYHDAAVRALAFIEKQRLDDGSWPQIIYDGGKKANWPRWNAGAADILLAYHVLEEKLPEQSLNRLLDSQLASGGFTTAEGFEQQIQQRTPSHMPHYRDLTPVVGWNDKVFRLLTLLVGEKPLPKATIGTVSHEVKTALGKAVFTETTESISIVKEKQVLYDWRKSDVWARIIHPSLDTH